MLENGFQNCLRVTDIGVGQVKINIEGLELPIFEALLQTLPASVSVALVMENFLNKLDQERFTAPIHHLEWFGVYKTRNWVKSIPLKLLGMSSYYVEKVEAINQEIEAPHDIIDLVNHLEKRAKKTYFCSWVSKAIIICPKHSIRCTNQQCSIKKLRWTLYRQWGCLVRILLDCTINRGGAWFLM